MHTEQEDRIRQRAHAIWEGEGQPEGRREEHCRQAWTGIQREDGSDPKEAYPTDVPPSGTVGG